jgi:hypothetical protein
VLHPQAWRPVLKWTADGQFTEVTVGGEQAWQNTGTSGYLYARRPDSFSFAAGQTLYVRVTYFDDAQGLIDLQYDSQSNAYTSSPLHTRTSRVGSGRFVNGYFELPDVRFNKRQNGSSDFRIICGTTGGAKVPVQRITLSDTPFDDPDFQLAVARAWQSRYTGPAKDYVDHQHTQGQGDDRLSGVVQHAERPQGRGLEALGEKQHDDPGKFHHRRVAGPHGIRPRCARPRR